MVGWTFYGILVSGFQLNKNIKLKKLLNIVLESTNCLDSSSAEDPGVPVAVSTSFHSTKALWLHRCSSGATAVSLRRDIHPQRLCVLVLEWHDRDPHLFEPCALDIDIPILEENFQFIPRKFVLLQKDQEAIRNEMLVVHSTDNDRLVQPYDLRLQGQEIVVDPDGTDTNSSENLNHFSKETFTSQLFLPDDLESGPHKLSSTNSDNCPRGASKLFAMTSTPCTVLPHNCLCPN